MPASAPFVQVQATEIADRIHELKGCFAQVFLAIGVFEVDPLGLSVKDLCRLLKLSRPTVSSALDSLEWDGFIKGQKDEHGTTRYRSCFGFVYRGSEQVSLRERDDVKKVFTSSTSTTLSLDPDPDPIKSSCTLDVQKIFTSVNLVFKGLDLREMTIERAEHIAAYVKANPEERANAASWAYACLKNNPKWEPPAQRVKVERRKLTREDFTDAEWSRMLPANRQAILDGDVLA